MSRAADQASWLRAVRAHPVLDTMNANGRTTLLAIAEQLAWSADWQTMTTRPTWALLGQHAGRSRATVARHLKRLRDAGLVGVVVSGWMADGPAALDQGPDAALYVLATPSPVTAVDKDETPSQFRFGFVFSSVLGQPRTRARGAEAEPLRGRAIAAAARPSRLSRERQLDQPPPRATSAQTDRQARILEVQRRVPATRSVSFKAMRSILRPFFLAGWTVNDVVHAVDYRPDGSLWPHEGSRGVRVPKGWLPYRLSAWVDDAGTVRRSPSQRVIADGQRLAALRRARQQRYDELMANAAPIDSPVVQTALAQIRAIADRARVRHRGASMRRGPVV